MRRARPGAPVESGRAFTLNTFTGAENTTFYGQLETSSNVYLALRYGF